MVLRSAILELPDLASRRILQYLSVEVSIRDLFICSL